VESARFNNRVVRLFKQPDNTSFGLMPVGVLTRPGTYKIEWLDSHGAELDSVEVTVASAHFPKQNVVLTKSLSGLSSTLDEREKVGSFIKEVSDVRYWTEPLERPIEGCATSEFGVGRYHNGKPTGDYHAGLDLRGAMGTPIHVAADGTVKLAEQFSLHGGTVAVDHGQGLESMYLHMSQIAAKSGERVKAGDVIGYVGSTGRSTGPHLHWTLYANGEPIDPNQWVHIAPCAAAPARKAKKRVKTT
jgi:murein DD-endopeptidase MepM/ murein hydrolase activator NlpD